MAEQNTDKPLVLYLPPSLRRQAMEMAYQQGVSLNFFITAALSERITKVEQKKAAAASRSEEEAKSG